ncbi:MAG: ABC transporter permease [Alphaproteobacteria bacterium]|nr:ABC transporter permease [Alphaproteobacteria bacterium]
MLRYIIRRILYMIPTMIGISFLTFMIIQLPPGDFLTTMLAYIADSTQGGITEALEQKMRVQYGLDKPLIVQYWKWISGIVFRGDFGPSFGWGVPVSQLIGDTMGLTLMVSLCSLIFVWGVSLPIGIYSAVNRYSATDHLFTLIGFLGLAIPNFLLALALMVFGYSVLGVRVGGLFSPEFMHVDWSWDKFVDLLGHIWIPVIVIGTSGTAALIRIMRANLADELEKPYVVTARAKGLPEWKILFKYPVRIAMNPFVSTIGWILPSLISGVTITAIVLNLPTSGPILIQALIAQDMYLAGSFIFLLSILTLFGMLISDILLALLDPRIRFN